MDRWFYLKTLKTFETTYKLISRNDVKLFPIMVDFPYIYRRLTVTLVP